MTRAAALRAAGKSKRVHGAEHGWMLAVPAIAGVVVVAILAVYCSGISEPGHDSEVLDTNADAMDLLNDVLRLGKERGRKESAFNSFSKPEFWEGRYSKIDKPFDWYGRWKDFGPHVVDAMPSSSGAILNVGCGSSRLAEELHAAGYRNVTNTDISPAAISQMTKKYQHLGQTFLVMDVVAMSFGAETFDVIIDKGTLDALYSGSTESVKLAVAEIWRVLKPGGRFLSITFGEAKKRREVRSLKWNFSRTIDIQSKPQNHYIHVMQKPGLGIVVF